jgi:hypothetical protein
MEWVVSVTPGSALPPGKGTPVPICVGDWVDPWVGPDTEAAASEVHTIVATRFVVTY